MVQKLTLSDNTKNKFLKTAIFFTVACCFFIPFSTSLMGATAALTTIFWFLSGNMKTLPHILRSNFSVLLALLLLFALAIAMAYSPTTFSESISTFKKYRELLFFVTVVCLIKAVPAGSKYCENSFLAGCIVLLTISYAMYFSLIPSERYGYSTVYHITHSFFMALLAFWCLQKCFNPGSQRVLWLLLLTASTINLFYIAPGRTGMLVFIALLFLTLYQRLSLKNSLLATLVTIIMITGTYLSSDNFSTRVKQAIDEIQQYQPNESRTSLGMRFDWWQNSITLMWEKPLAGHGTGSFEKVQGDLVKGSLTKPSDNPHNEYLLIGVQTGMIGLLLFISLLLGLLVHSRKLKSPQRYLLQGVVVAMAFGSIMNSFLHDSHPGHFFAFISAILYCAVEEKKDDPKEIEV